MIVDSMTHVEVYQELERDREAMTRWWSYKKESIRRRVLKSTHFPLCLWFEYVSPRKIHYLFYTRIFDRHMKKFLTGIVAIKRSNDGMTVYTNWLSDQKLICPMVLLPHMWKRYQDPKRGNVQKSGIDLVKHYFSNNAHGKDTQNPKVMARSVRYNGENHQACCVTDGVLLGHVVDDIFVVKTFITYDMSCGLQLKEFEHYRKQILTDREMYDRARLAYW